MGFGLYAGISSGTGQRKRVCLPASRRHSAGICTRDLFPVSDFNPTFAPLYATNSTDISITGTKKKGRDYHAPET